MVPENLKYTKEHEWAKIDGSIATIGITDHAQSELGDVVFVELPQVNKKLAQMQDFGAVESVKTVSNLFSPVSGEVVEVNKDLLTASDLINKDPYGKGWIIKVKMSNSAETDNLLSPQDYKNLIKQ